MPKSWYWPERMAARMVGESSRWDAGTRLMRSESPQALNALEQAADLLRHNREAIEAYQNSAANAKQPVRCTVRIRAGIEPRGIGLPISPRTWHGFVWKCPEMVTPTTLEVKSQAISGRPKSSVKLVIYVVSRSRSVALNCAKSHH
jgi:hypothetical protein